MAGGENDKQGAQGQAVQLPVRPGGEQELDAQPLQWDGIAGGRGAEAQRCLPQGAGCIAIGRRGQGENAQHQPWAEQEADGGSYRKDFSFMATEKFTASHKTLYTIFYTGI